ncbi:hypothetical protein N2152v2_008543 [Parachlorella kessleri]
MESTETLHVTNPLHLQPLLDLPPDIAGQVYDAAGHDIVHDTASDEAIAQAVAAAEGAPDQHAAAAHAAASARSAELDKELALQAHEDEVTSLCRELSGVLSVAPQLFEEGPLERQRSETLTQRLSHASSVKLVPHVNLGVPLRDAGPEARQRLDARLDLYGLTERLVKGDGNCQFRALSDQLYRTPRLHAFVRECTVAQLRRDRQRYEGWVPADYDAYCRAMARSGEWGDHVTLQAAADYFGLKICVLTSFPEGAFIEIMPQRTRSSRILYLSFWAEVHYNSVYMQEDPPAPLPSEKLFGSRKLYNLLFRDHVPAN